MNIAVFGGSFDPPHIGHEKIVYSVLDNLDIDKFIIVPTFLNPFKSHSHFSPKVRYELLNQLFDNSKKIEISDFEINNNKPSKTIDTINYLKKTYKPKKIYFVMGADNLDKLHLWHKFEKLKDLITFVIISREGYEVKNDIIQFINIEVNIDTSSSKLRTNLDLKYIPNKIKQKVKQLWNKG